MSSWKERLVADIDHQRVKTPLEPAIEGVQFTPARPRGRHIELLLEKWPHTSSRYLRACELHRLLWTMPQPQREMMRALVRTSGSNWDRVCRQYASAEACGRVI